MSLSSVENRGFDQSPFLLTLLGVLMGALDSDGNLLEIHVQSQFEHRVDWGIALRRILCCRVHVMNGLMVCFLT
jgi:hypothetical protein